MVRRHELQLALAADASTLVIDDQRRVVDGAVPLAKVGGPDHAGDGVRATRGRNSAFALE